MNRVCKTLAGLAVGAGSMYYLDPQRGSRRRALVLDKAVHYRRLSRRFLGAALEDLGHRFKGMLFVARHLFFRQKPSEAALLDEIRRQIRGIVSHPASIVLLLDDGKVILRGPILAVEVQPLLETVSSLPYIHAVDNELDVHQEPGNVSGLQGEPARHTERRPELLQDNWLPGTRLLIGAGSLLLLAEALRRHTAGSLGGGLVGILGLTRAIRNRPLLGARGHRSKPQRPGRRHRSQSPRHPAEAGLSS